MARHAFGGVMAAWVVSAVEAPDLGEDVQALILPDTAVQIQVYDAPDGTQVTDLLDENNNPITEITVPAGDPYIPVFYGPDGVESLWVEAASGRWVPMPRFDDGSMTGGGDDDEDEVKLSGDNHFEYPDSNSNGDPWLRIDVPNDNTNSNDWPNRMEFRYYDQSTSQYREGFYINEKALLRTRGVTPTDVPVRFMSHPTQAANVPIMETTKSDNSVKLFQSFESQTVSLVPMVVPFLVNMQGERLYFGTADPATDPAYADYRPNVGDAWVDFNGE
jgi:hypothetical protein